jgi:hypothetical protein
VFFYLYCMFDLKAHSYGAVVMKKHRIFHLVQKNHTPEVTKPICCFKGGTVHSPPHLSRSPKLPPPPQNNARNEEHTQKRNTIKKAGSKPNLNKPPHKSPTPAPHDSQD